MLVWFVVLGLVCGGVFDETQALSGCLGLGCQGPSANALGGLAWTQPLAGRGGLWGGVGGEKKCL